MTTNTIRLSQFLLSLIAASFVLNWIWEMLQMPAFVEMAGKSWSQTARICTVATFGDVAMTLAICGLGSLASGNLRWGLTGRWNVYVTAAVLGGLSAAAFEWFAMATERWTYNAYMPLVPGLKVGLWPLLQLTVLTPLSFGIARLIVVSLERAQERPSSQGLVA